MFSMSSAASPLPAPVARASVDASRRRRRCASRSRPGRRRCRRDRRARARTARPSSRRPVAGAVQAREAVGGGDLVVGVGALGRCADLRGRARLRTAGGDAGVGRPGDGRRCLSDAPAAGSAPPSSPGRRPTARRRPRWRRRRGRRGGHGGPSAARRCGAARCTRPARAPGRGRDGDREPPGARRPRVKPPRPQRGADACDRSGVCAEAGAELLGGQEMAIGGVARRGNRLGVGGQRSGAPGSQRHPDVQAQRRRDRRRASHERRVLHHADPNRLGRRRRRRGQGARSHGDGGGDAGRCTRSSSHRRRSRLPATVGRLVARTISSAPEAGLQAPLDRRPLVVDHRVVRRVPRTAVADHHVLAQDPLELGPEGLAGPPASARCARRS